MKKILAALPLVFSAMMPFAANADVSNPVLREAGVEAIALDASELAVTKGSGYNADLYSLYAYYYANAASSDFYNSYAYYTGRNQAYSIYSGLLNLGKSTEMAAYSFWYFYNNQ